MASISQGTPDVATSSAPDGTRRDANGARRRWIGAAAGLIVAGVDVFGAAAFGVSFAISGHDATAFVWLYLAVSFATLGYLAGRALDERHAERHAAALLRARMDEVARAHARLAQAEKLAALGQLAATVTHEVRNSLGVIRSAAQDLGERAAATDDGAVRSSRLLVEEVDRLTRVVAALLGYARPVRPARRRIAVGALLERAEMLAAPVLAAKGAALRRRAEPSARGVALEADPDLLCQVLLGLVTNAVDAVPAGGEVVLEARRVASEATAPAGELVELVVEDNGPGVPPELRERVFEPFFTTREGGNGLGLAIARKLVELHGGTIELDDAARRPTSATAGGARFVVRLPALSGAGLAPTGSP